MRLVVEVSYVIVFYIVRILCSFGPLSIISNHLNLGAPCPPLPSLSAPNSPCLQPTITHRPSDWPQIANCTPEALPRHNNSTSPLDAAIFPLRTQKPANMATHYTTPTFLSNQKAYQPRHRLASCPLEQMASMAPLASMHVGGETPLPRDSVTEWLR